MSLLLFILKRFLITLPTILVVSLIGFTLMRYDFTLGPLDIPTGSGSSWHLMDEVRIKNPIDPLAALRSNPQISQAALDAETRRLGLDKPMWAQYQLWLSHVLQVVPETLTQGQWWAFWQPDLGKTFTGEDVTDVLARRAGNTVMLNIASMLITWLIAIPLGVLSALYWRSWFDRSLTILSSIGMALPSFVLALLMAYLAVKTGWFPLGGIRSDAFDTLNPVQQWLDIAHHLALPITVLTILGIAGLQRQMRANLLDVLGMEYIRTARAKGLPELVVIYRHAVRNAINPMITLLGYEFSSLLSGSLLVEIVLDYPGLGSLMYQAVQETDTNLVMASLIMSAVMLVLGNLLADVLLKWADPRIELA